MSITQRKIGDVAQINPESLGSSTSPDFEFKYIDISSVDYGKVDWHTVAFHRFDKAPSRARRVVRQNDILLCTVRPTLQAHTIHNWNDSEFYVCSTGFAVIRASDEIVPRYLYHAIFQESLIAQIRQIEVGSNYPAINQYLRQLCRVIEGVE
jgi:type I restriction enzyme, S subunit